MSAKNVKGGRLDFSTPEFISVPDYDKWRTRGVTAPGDVFITTEAPVGEVAPHPASGVVQISRRVMALRADEQRLHWRYLLYVLQSADVQACLLGRNRGTTVPRVLKPDITELDIPFPPLDEQRRIAAVLGALDDKIELNRKMNRTLEEMAHALFKSWFIDFDGHEDLADSELGPIPRGWEVLPISDVVEVMGGSTPRTKNPEYWDGGEIHWTTPKDLSSLSTSVLLDTARKITPAGLAKISSGLLPQGTLLLSSRAPVGYLAISQIPVAVNQGYIAMPPGGRASPLWLLYWAASNMDRIKARAGGTTFAEISKRNFRPIPVVLPPTDELARFDVTVGPLFERVVANERESHTLAALRDTLLPKLISGELRVPEAEAAVEAAT